MLKAFDVSKYRKNLTKSITGMSQGFNVPTAWISTGNYALNYLVSGDFQKGIPKINISKPFFFCKSNNNLHTLIRDFLLYFYQHYSLISLQSYINLS